MNIFISTTRAVLLFNLTFSNKSNDNDPEVKDNEDANGLGWYNISRGWYNLLLAWAGA